MALASGAALGPYVIVTPLGAGALFSSVTRGLTRAVSIVGAAVPTALCALVLRAQR